MLLSDDMVKYSGGLERGFNNSNLNYGVLGRVIEVRSGPSLRAFLRNKLFLPLTMKHTSIGIDPNVSQFRAARYGRGGKRLPDYQASPAAAADIWSSALDLVRFGQLYCPSEGVDRATSLMPSSSIQSMLTTLIPMGRQYYGLGWVISRDALGRTRVRHGGAGAGVGAELTILPSEELVIAVLVNADTSMPSEPKILPTRIADAILDQILLGQRQPSAPEQPPKVHESQSKLPPAFHPFIGS